MKRKSYKVLFFIGGRFEEGKEDNERSYILDLFKKFSVSARVIHAGGGTPRTEVEYYENGIFTKSLACV